MKRLMRMLALLAALAMLCGALTACRNTEPVVITPVEEEEPDPPDPYIPEDQLRFTDLLTLNATHIPWSWLEPYQHTLIGDNTAQFTIALNTDPSVVSVMTVTFDKEANEVLTADATYGDVTVSLLTENNGDLLPLLAAMDGAK